MHVIDSAAIFSDSGVITVEDFQFPGQQLRPVHPEAPVSGSAAGTQAEGAAGSAVRVAVEQVEERLIRDAMVRCGGNKKRVATELGISRSYLYKRLAAIALD
jgi:DNA-binding NtrC family response regulator